MYVKYVNGMYNVSVYVKDEGKFKYMNMPESCYVKIMKLCGTMCHPPKLDHSVSNIRSFILNRSAGIFTVNEVFQCFEIKHIIKQSDDKEFFKRLEIL